jgi:hypothetical protein
MQVAAMLYHHADSSISYIAATRDYKFFQMTASVNSKHNDKLTSEQFTETFKTDHYIYRCKYVKV